MIILQLSRYIHPRKRVYLLIINSPKDSLQIRNHLKSSLQIKPTVLIMFQSHILITV